MKKEIINHLNKRFMPLFVSFFGLSSAVQGRWVGGFQNNLRYKKENGNG